jgi:hypothetical protein
MSDPVRVRQESSALENVGCKWPLFAIIIALILAILFAGCDSDPSEPGIDSLDGSFRLVRYGSQSLPHTKPAGGVIESGTALIGMGPAPEPGQTERRLLVADNGRHPNGSICNPSCSGAAWVVTGSSQRGDTTVIELSYRDPQTGTMRRADAATFARIHRDTLHYRDVVADRVYVRN